MTNYQIWAQVVAVTAIAFKGIGAQSKTQTRFLLWQVIINLSMTFHYILLGAFTGLIVEMICVARTIVFYIYSKQNKPIPNWIVIAIFALCLGAGIFTWQGILSIFPVISAIVFTYAQWQRNITRTRHMVMLGDISWIVYNFFFAGYVNMVGRFVEIISCAIALAKDKKSVS